MLTVRRILVEAVEALDDYAFLLQHYSPKGFLPKPAPTCPEQWCDHNRMARERHDVHGDDDDLDSFHDICDQLFRNATYAMKRVREAAIVTGVPAQLALIELYRALDEHRQYPHQSSAYCTAPDDLSGLHTFPAAWGLRRPPLLKMIRTELEGAEVPSDDLQPDIADRLEDCPTLLPVFKRLHDSLDAYIDEAQVGTTEGEIRGRVNRLRRLFTDEFDISWSQANKQVRMRRVSSPP